MRSRTAVSHPRAHLLGGLFCLETKILLLELKLAVKKVLYYIRHPLHESVEGYLVFVLSNCLGVSGLLLLRLGQFGLEDVFDGDDGVEQAGQVEAGSEIV